MKKALTCYDGRHITYIMRINVPLLKQQKMALLECNMRRREKDGLLNLLDAIQDIAEGIRC